MAKITVAHHNLHKKGGGEAVCVAVLESLQDDHSVKLLLSSGIEDLDEINEYFESQLDNVEIESVDVFHIELLDLMELVNKISIWKFQFFGDIVNHALYNRYYKRSIEDQDLFISTWDEISVEENSIQYIHWPRRYQNLVSTENLSVNNLTLRLIQWFKQASKWFGDFNPSEVSESTLLANSNRTANQIEEWYGVSPEILNPPIRTSELSATTDWSERENGFIFLSRIAPVKNLEWVINIITGIHNNGYDIHLHIIGPKDEDCPEYYQYIQNIVSEYDYISVEGPMYGGELNEMLRTHKYGINGAKKEQFGMSIAEMVAAGMIPFVPNGGGQTKIVGENSEVMFNTTEEAVKKISDVISNQDVRHRIKSEFPDIEEEYGIKRFQKKIKNLVD